MKILHVVNIPFVIPYFLGEQISYFSNKGTSIHIACRYDKKIDKYKLKWNFIFFNLKISRSISILSDINDIFRLCNYIKVNDIDVIVGHTPKGAFIAMIAGKISGIKKRIYIHHGLMYETKTGLKKCIFSFLDKITCLLSSSVICVSQSLKSILITQNITSIDKAKIIEYGTSNGIDFIHRFNKKLISSDEIKKIKLRYSIFGDCIVVGYIGRLARDKGLNELIYAWRILQAKYTNIKLFLCGPVDERDPLSLDVLDIVNNDKSIFNIGEIENTPLYYSIFDIFVLPSYREGFPTVVLEASAMSIPIITTKSTGCIDSIIENVTGIFSEIEPHSLSEAIEFYLENPDIRKEHGSNGRNFVEKNFNQKKIWEILEHEYL